MVEGLIEYQLMGESQKVEKNLLKYVKSNFEKMSLRNIESLRDILFPLQKEILGIVERKAVLRNEVKCESFLLFSFRFR